MLKLPELVCLNDYNGDWDKYLEIIYSFFKKDFIDSRPQFKGIKISLKKYPKLNGKEATFWHLISEGKIEQKKIPDMRRCERIKWPRPIIENYQDENIRYWENKRMNEERVCLCFGEWEYLVVLSKRKGYILIWTAYPVTYGHTKIKLKKEYEEYSLKANTAQEGGIVTPSTRGG